MPSVDLYNLPLASSIYNASSVALSDSTSGVKGNVTSIVCQSLLPGLSLVAIQYLLPALVRQTACSLYFTVF